MTRWDDFPVTLGTVISIDPDSAMAMVDVEGAEAPAWMPDHLWLGTESGPAVAAGSTVTLLRMIGGYQMVSAFTGTAGGGVPTLGPELLANGTFESGAVGALPTGWAAFNDAWTVTDDSPVEGSQCVRLDFPADAEVREMFRQYASRVDPGLTYRLSGFVAASTTSGIPTARLEVITGTSDGEAGYFGTDDGVGTAGLLTQVVDLVNPGEAWPFMEGDFTVPAGHTYIRVAVKVVAALGTESVVRFDALSLKQRLA